MFNVKKYHKQWREKNKEREKQKHKNYYKQNREMLLNKKKQYYLTHLEQIRQYKKEYRKKNIEHIKTNHQKYYNTPSVKKRILKYHYFYCRNNHNKINAYVKKRKMQDNNYLIKTRLRSLLWQVLKKYSTTGKIMSSKKYGIDYEAIVKHLGECPDLINKKDWHINHIKPLYYFNLNNINEIKKAFAPENLEWLPAKENMSRGAKLSWHIH